MSDIKPRDSRLLTDIDIDYAPFRCCGDEDLVFLRCEHCGHVWVECYECSTWYVSLNDLSRRESAVVSDADQRPACPACRKPFADFFYLKNEHVDRYLATAEQVIDSGFGRYLASHLRPANGSMSPSKLEEALRKIEHTLVCEGGIVWREMLLHGRAADFAWPAELPPLSAELKTWFSWESTSALHGGGWRSVTWTVREHGALSDNPAFPRSLLPIFSHHLIDSADGSAWIRTLDDEGEERFQRQPFADLAELLVAVEAEHATRRHSRWRRFRVERAADAAWAKLEALPELAELVRAPLGTALLLRPVQPRMPRGQLLLKISAAEWLGASYRRNGAFEDSHVEDMLEALRFDFASGDGSLLDVYPTNEAAAAQLETAWTRLRAKSAVESWRGALHVWQRPSMAELLVRLDRVLGQGAPEVRRSLAQPAPAEELVALERAVGSSLPTELRELWSFAGGQAESQTLYWGHRLAGPAEAQRTGEMMQELAAEQFGEAYWDRGFVALLDRGNGDHLCVDVAGVYGPPGCVVDFDHGWPERRRILFDGVADWLECFVEGLEAGIYVASAGEGIFPRGFFETGSTEEIARHDAVRSNGRYPWERHLLLRSGATRRS